jgi:hypothetical protein
MCLWGIEGFMPTRKQCANWLIRGEKTLVLLGFRALFVRERKDCFGKKICFRVVMGDQKGSGGGLFENSG